MLVAWVLIANVLAAAAVAKTPVPRRDDLEAFVSERHAWCDKYRAEPDPKKKKAVFAKYSKVVKGRTFATPTAVPATVAETERTADGERVSLTVNTSFGECSNRDLWVLDSAYHVDRGTPLYEAIGALAEGDAVTVSFAHVRPWHDELLQQESVCGKRWVVQYTVIERTR